MYFPDRPASSVGDLQRDVSEAFAKVGNSALSGEPIRDISVTTTQTPVRHGLRGVPSFFVILQTSGTGPVRRSAASDSENIYIISNSGTCTADVLIIP